MDEIEEMESEICENLCVGDLIHVLLNRIEKTNGLEFVPTNNINALISALKGN